MNPTRPLLRHPRTLLFPALALATLIAAACGRESAPDELARPAKLFTVPGATADGFRNYPATVGAHQTADLAFEVSGTLAEFPVNAGQMVQAGQVLARLDSRDFQSALDAATATHHAATAEFNRQKTLYENRATSLAKFQSAQRDLDVARAERDKARKALESTFLKAPFPGRVARKGPDNFGAVKAGEFIVQLQDIRTLEASVDVSENDVVLAVRGAAVEAVNQRLREEGRLPQIEFPTLPGVRLPLTLKSFETVADPATRTFRITFQFDPGGHNILPGMTANVLAKPPSGHATPDVLLVPASAVIEDPIQGRIVWKVHPDTQAVSPVPVETASLVGGQIGILSGLQPGDTIVAAGARTLRPGMKVKPLLEPTP